MYVLRGNKLYDTVLEGNDGLFLETLRIVLKPGKL